MKQSFDHDTDRGVISVDGSKKARIERAALTLFAQNGIDHVTTKAIATAAGVSEGLIYRHFNNKEDLGRTLMLAAHQGLTEIIVDAADMSDIRAQIRHITSRYCEIADRQSVKRGQSLDRSGDGTRRHPDRRCPYSCANGIGHCFTNRASQSAWLYNEPAW